MQGSVLRREGIYSSQLSTWRRQLKRGDLDAANLKARAHRKANADVSTFLPSGSLNSKRKIASYDVTLPAQNSSERYNKKLRGSWGWTSRATTEAN
jgi:hypothetical protein